MFQTDITLSYFFHQVRYWLPITSPQNTTSKSLNYSLRYLPSCCSWSSTRWSRLSETLSCTELIVCWMTVSSLSLSWSYIKMGKQRIESYRFNTKKSLSCFPSFTLSFHLHLLSSDLCCCHPDLHDCKTNVCGVLLLFSCVNETWSPVISWKACASRSAPVTHSVSRFTSAFCSMTKYCRFLSSSLMSDWSTSLWSFILDLSALNTHLFCVPVIWRL